MNFIKLTFVEDPGFKITEAVEKWRKEVEDQINAGIEEAVLDTVAYGTGATMTATEVEQRKQESNIIITEQIERWSKLCTSIHTKKEQ